MFSSHLHPILDNRLYSNTLQEVGGAPWLFKHPEARLLEWQGRCRQLLDRQQKLAQNIVASQSVSTSSGITNKRLKLLQQGYEDNGKILQNLLRPLWPQEAVASEVFAGVHDPLPTKQQADSYYDNIFRDWCWANGENQKTIDIFNDLIGSPNLKGTVAVLGAGAGRLAADLHVQWQSPHTVLMDINPVLMFVAKAMIAGETLELIEFPITPLTTKDMAVRQVCESPHGVLNNIDCVFADVSQMPFSSEALAVVVTPWVIDIIPEDFRSFSKRINQVVEPDGLWINHGPLGFSHANPIKNYSAEEVEALVVDAGFEVMKTVKKRIPYLQSPHGGYWRDEWTFSFAAKKVKSVPAPEEYHALPEWLTDWQHPVPINPALQQLCFTHQVHAQVLSTVNGKLSFNDIAELMQKHYKMSETQAQEALFTLLSRLHEASR